MDVNATEQARTPLHDAHVAAGARMTRFAGWSMPLHYGSQIAEHHEVRRAAGMFDVSHMTVIDVDGADGGELLARVLANDAAKAVPGKAVYSMLLNEAAGVVDDVIVYGRASGYRVVANGATRAKVLAWFAKHRAGFRAELCERRDLALIAVQGPGAVAIFADVTAVDAGALAPFSALEHGEWMVARTGYTGEDGIEAILPGSRAVELWQSLQAAGVAPAGLAARDTLRVEAGLMLYGQDMDESTTPLESSLAWTVAWSPRDRVFVGREALARQRAEKPRRVLRGVVMEGRGIMRPGHPVLTDVGEGAVTSGIFSPTLGYSIGFARVPRNAASDCSIAIRGTCVPGRFVKLPFVRHGIRVFQ